MTKEETAYTMVKTLAEEMEANGIDAAMRLAESKYGIVGKHLRDALLRMGDYLSPVDFALFGFPTREAFIEAKARVRLPPSKVEIE